MLFVLSGCRQDRKSSKKNGDDGAGEVGGELEDEAAAEHEDEEQFIVRQDREERQHAS